MLCDCSCEPKNPPPKVIISGSSSLAMEKCTKRGRKLSRQAPYTSWQSPTLDGISEFEKSKRALTSQAAGCGNWIRQVSNCALFPLEKSSFLIRASSPTRNSSQVCVWHLFRKGLLERRKKSSCLNFLLLPPMSGPTHLLRPNGRKGESTSVSRLGTSPPPNTHTHIFPRRVKKKRWRSATVWWVHCCRTKSGNARESVNWIGFRHQQKKKSH